MPEPDPPRLSMSAASRRLYSSSLDGGAKLLFLAPPLPRCARDDDGDVATGSLMVLIGLACCLFICVSMRLLSVAVMVVAEAPGLCEGLWSAEEEEEARLRDT